MIEGLAQRIMSYQWSYIYLSLRIYIYIYYFNTSSLTRLIWTMRVKTWESGIIVGCDGSKIWVGSTPDSTTANILTVAFHIVKVFVLNQWITICTHLQLQHQSPSMPCSSHVHILCSIIKKIQLMIILE